MEEDPTASGTLQAFINIAGMVDWSTNAKVGPDVNVEIADKQKKFLESCWEDMHQSIHDIVEAALDMLVAGHNVQIPQFKVRRGYYPNKPSWNSIHDDMRIGWKSWKTLDPMSIDRWILEDGEGYSALEGCVQRSARGKVSEIPRNRMLLFRSTSRGDLPEGESLFYGAYSTWKSKEYFIKLEEVAQSRNLEGIPKVWAPPEYLSDSATPEEQEFVEYLINISQNLKYNEQTGLVLPAMFDDNGNRLVDVELMTAANNTRLDSSRVTIKDKEKLIAESMLSSFIKLGDGGSNALSNDQTSMFILAMRTYLNRIKHILNSEAIPTLFRANGMDMNHVPYIEFSGLEKDSVTQYVDNVTKALKEGAILPSAEVQEATLKKLELPTAAGDAAWKEKEVRDEEDRKLIVDQAKAVSQVNTAPKQEVTKAQSPKPVEGEYGMKGASLYRVQKGKWELIAEEATRDQNGKIHTRSKESGEWEELCLTPK